MSIDNQFISEIKKEIAQVGAEAKAADTKAAAAAAAADLTKITGYDATKVQTLKNDEGTIKWVTDEAPAGE